VKQYITLEIKNTEKKFFRQGIKWNKGKYFRFGRSRSGNLTLKNKPVTFPL
jgi:hypothetical protein